MQLRELSIPGNSLTAVTSAKIGRRSYTIAIAIVLGLFISAMRSGAAENSQQTVSIADSVQATDSFGRALAKVIAAAPSDFSTIKGKQTDSNESFEEFECTVSVPGFDAGSINRSKDGGDFFADFRFSSAYTEDASTEADYNDLKKRLRQLVPKWRMVENKTPERGTQSSVQFEKNHIALALTWHKRKTKSYLKISVHGKIHI